ncbi:hypothetical protein FGB62_85g02 [Gracilaria domingensis]|nr:hypothetical protein FGB62_85g02 [Gracilaria domingensis]
MVDDVTGEWEKAIRGECEPTVGGVWAGGISIRGWNKRASDIARGGAGRLRGRFVRFLAGCFGASHTAQLFLRMWFMVPQLGQRRCTRSLPRRVSVECGRRDGWNGGGGGGGTPGGGAFHGAAAAVGGTWCGGAYNNADDAGVGSGSDCSASGALYSAAASSCGGASGASGSSLGSSADGGSSSSG